MPGYWLDGWLEGNGHLTVESAVRALDHQQAFEEARDVAEQWRQAVDEPDVPDTALLAGPGLDLSPTTHCGHELCAREQVEHLVRNSLHYYESIIFPDYLGDLLTNELATGISEPTSRNALIRPCLAAYFALRDVGALPFVRFYAGSAETRRQERLWSADARDYSLSLGEFKRQLRRSVAVQPLGSFVWRITNDLTPDDAWTISAHMDRPDDLIAHNFVEDRMETLLGAAARSTVLAKHLGIPGAHSDLLFLKFHEIATKGAGRDMLTFELPMLSSVPVDALVDLRTKYPAAFAQVRADLRDAAAQLGSVAPTALEAKVLRPALREVEARLADSRKTLRDTFWGQTALIAATTILYPWDTRALSLAALGGATALAQNYRQRRRVVADNPYGLFWKAIHKH